MGHINWLDLLENLTEKFKGFWVRRGLTGSGAIGLFNYRALLFQVVVKRSEYNKKEQYSK